jgi:hypothetical protein
MVPCIVSFDIIRVLTNKVTTKYTFGDWSLETEK